MPRENTTSCSLTPPYGVVSFELKSVGLRITGLTPLLGGLRESRDHPQSSPARWQSPSEPLAVQGQTMPPPARAAGLRGGLQPLAEPLAPLTRCQTGKVKFIPLPPASGVESSKTLYSVVAVLSQPRPRSSVARTDKSSCAFLKHFSSPLSLFTACNVPYCKGVPYSYFFFPKSEKL